MSRFTVLTDAAIALVAASGMRGLTHRAVDAAAGLPEGTTSAYFRTRKALIEATVRRLAELDRADVAAEALPMDGPPAASLDAETLAVGIATLLDRWLADGRERMLVRYACLLEATHHPELREILEYGVVFRTQATRILEALGAKDPERAGRHFVACVDGLLFDRLIGAGALSAPAPGSRANVEDLTEAVRSLVRAATA